jgi:insertion element IS1 protein InsB
MEVNPYIIDKAEADKLGCLDVQICLSTEWDEFWSYVGNKSKQRWTWYLMTVDGRILAWHNGARTDASLKALLDKVAHFPISICHSDDLLAYSKLFPPEYTHLIGKDRTWRIERRNLNFRTHIKRLNRKTICFSKSTEMHDIVIGLYINQYYFKHGSFSKAARA